MKCTKQPKFLHGKPTPMTEVWEVRLAKPLFLLVREAARNRNVSYSTITRYCVFRLASHQNLRMRKPFLQADAEIKRMHQKEAEIHRHLVCLYGEDVKLLRLAALKMGISVSQLVRIALFLYLPRLALDIHSRKQVGELELFWRGIKQWLAIPIKSLNLLRAPAVRQYTFASFLPEHWWPRSSTHGGGAMRLRATA